MQPLQAGDPERIGRFRLQGRLGAGGMGRVYLGASADGVQAAIKVIRDELADEPGFRHRFRREVAAATAVAGMFTARVLDADPEADPPWLATEFVPGLTVAQAVLERGPLSEVNQLRLARELAEALSAIHAAGLVHRDLKPANVLLSPTSAKVIDFGIAHAVDSTRLTTVGSILGTPDYMAPEQVLTPDRSGPPADVFAMGATLAFAATGRSPFGTEQPASTLYRVVNLAPDLVGMPPASAVIARACLDKDPTRRPLPAALAAQLRAAQLGADRLGVTQLGAAQLGADRLGAAQLGADRPEAGRAIRFAEPAGGTAPGPPRRGRIWPALVAAAAVLITLVVAVAMTGGARTAAGPTVASTPTAVVTSAPVTSASNPPTADPDSPQVRYLDRLCASGQLLVSLGDTATTPQATGDPAVARRDFLAAVDRSVATVDAALVDLIVLRDEAPTAEIRTRFGLVVREFTAAKQAFTRARAGVAASNPLQVAAYRTGITRFAVGVRNLSLAAQLMKDITLPPDYTAASASAPRCNR